MAKLLDLKVIEIPESEFESKFEGLFENFKDEDFKDDLVFKDYMMEYFETCVFSKEEILTDISPIIDNYTLKQVEVQGDCYYRIVIL